MCQLEADWLTAANPHFGALLCEAEAEPEHLSPWPAGCSLSSASGGGAGGGAGGRCQKEAGRWRRKRDLLLLFAFCLLAVSEGTALASLRLGRNSTCL